MFLRKLDDGRELRGYSFADSEVKVLSDNEIELVGSTETVDRDGDIVVPSGIDLKNFKRNPVILAGHNYRDPAIGKGVATKREGKLVFKVIFPPEGDNPMADIYRKLYKGGFMRAGSIGFIPTEWSDTKDKKGAFIRTYSKSELLEFSLVTVPSNPDAVVQNSKGLEEAKEKGVINDVEKSQVENYMKIAASRKEEESDVRHTKEEANANPAANSPGAEKPEKKPAEKEKKDEKEYMTREDVEKLIDARLNEITKKIEKAMNPHYSKELLELPGPVKRSSGGPTKDQLAVAVTQAIKSAL